MTAIGESLGDALMYAEIITGGNEIYIVTDSTLCLDVLKEGGIATKVQERRRFVCKVRIATDSKLRHSRKTNKLPQP